MGSVGDLEKMACALTLADNAPDPTSVLRMQSYPIPSGPGPEEVVVQMLAAPVNPQDFLITAGLYPIKPLHSINDEQVPGYDGVGCVLGVGSKVTEIRSGDLVIPRGQGFGTWRTHAVVSAAECAKVPHCSDIRFAAILKMTLLPAYFLVEDLVNIRPGDWIIQNAGTSTIAQMVSQFARLKGAHTLNIIRDSQDGTLDVEAAKMLQAKGADVVCTESDFEAKAAEILQGKRVKLALDCVWGKSAEVINLPANAQLVNFANLSGGGPKATVSLPHACVFGTSATIKGWKSTSSLATRSNQEMDDLTTWILDFLEKGVLRMPEYQSVAWTLEAGSGTPQGSAEDLQKSLIEVIGRAHQPGARKKKVLFEFRG
jgi:mitochondrial enoyl-[acyl-carrier protein] reductase / trans-2-enoyl-CoA reductase